MIKMILVASPTWRSTIALTFSLSTILESLSSLPLRINNEYDDLVGGIDEFCTQTNILQFLLKWENHLIMLAACWFAWLPAGLGPRSTTCFKASITLSVMFWFTWSMLIALNNECVCTLLKFTLKSKSTGRMLTNIHSPAEHWNHFRRYSEEHQVDCCERRRPKTKAEQRSKHKPGARLSSGGKRLTYLSCVSLAFNKLTSVHKI